MQVLDNVRSTATVGEGNRSAHMKQCAFNVLPIKGCEGANPSPDLVPKTKSHLRLHSGCDLA
jgi:hypothetical protein